jgi:uncharacterized protein involved in exopolysaccharide biosynthesis
MRQRIESRQGAGYLFHDLDDEPPPARAPFWRPLLRRALIVLVIYAVMTAIALAVVSLAPSKPFLP